MVNNKLGDKSGNILVEFDYNNIILVDPNKTIDSQGKISERLVDHEDMIMYANLEADVLPRTKLAVGGVSQDNNRTISVAKINFLKPNDGKSLNNNYVDEITGKGSTSREGTNQRFEKVNFQDGKAYYQDTVLDQNNIVDNGLLGITSIIVRTNNSFVPSVKIELEDVQGRALFQLGNDSPYAAFFNLPYPQFYLTLKGYYGQAIKYQLNLEKFNARFNSFSGNYQITLEFSGYKFNILNEISIGNTLAVPHMYSQTYNITENTDTNSETNEVSQVTTKKGYQKIREVYGGYKSKGLIPVDFPELTMVQLMNKLEKFEDNILNQYPKGDLTSLTDIRTYKKTLKNFYDDVRTKQNSWFNKYIDKNPLVTTSGEIGYFLKKSVYTNTSALSDVKVTLEQIIRDYNRLLSENKTLGDKAPNQIGNNISYNLIHMSKPSINWGKTSELRTGNTNSSEQIRTSYDELFRSTLKIDIDNITDGIYDIDFFIFEGQNRFDETISNIDTQVNKKLSDFENKISQDLAKRFESSEYGIGFKPTVRNIMAVIMASTEAFIKLMDDVHTSAWDLKYDPIRRNSVFTTNTSVKGSDDPDDDSDSEDKPVYPWPQFFVETNDDKGGKYQITYIADPSVVNQTKGYRYDKWPEVEFVEEYTKGLTMKFDQPDYPDPLDNDKYTNIITLNAIEYPQRGIPYLNKEEIKFFYEIWERQFLTSNYSGFGRLNPELIQKLIKINSESEVINIVSSLGNSSPSITKKLKEYGLSSKNYVDTLLKTISNQGTGTSYQKFIRGLFVTSNITNITQNSFSILSTNDLGKDPQQYPNNDSLMEIVKSNDNTQKIIDVLPYTDSNWVGSNMDKSKLNSGDEVYNTNKTLKVYGYRNLISNFTDVYNFTENRPVTNFSFYFEKQVTNEDVKPVKNLIATEGIYDQNDLNGNTVNKVTSMLNTPFFVNSVLNGVRLDRSDNLYPYVQAAYLFINSLPLATLRERYKSLNNGETIELDYISSVFKKFGAIHKMPYAWVLKYGSIWHRYKKFIETGTDILESAWGNFDQVSNYDPIDNTKDKKYSFKYEDNDIEIILQSENNGSVDLQVGFYPKTISDFNYFYNGHDLYKDYDDSDIDKSIRYGVKLHNFSNSNITSNFNDNVESEKTWSVIVPKRVEDISTIDNCILPDNTQKNGYYIVPSFGTNTNTVFTEYSENGELKIDLKDNNSVFNGSVRLLWGSSNYGYFNSDELSMPKPNQYINKIFTNGDQSSFKIFNNDFYSNIEEIFSVFDSSILDQFEIEFLNFTKKSNNINVSNIDLTGDYSQYRNFQLLMSKLMFVRSKRENESDDTYFDEIIKEQYSNFQTDIKNFLQYDVILKYGNPSNYNRRNFESYVSHLSNVKRIESPITFEPYIPNTLPSLGGTITLEQSKTNNPEAWKVMETKVGFSKIRGAVYSNDGSYFTDFFIDNNISFTSQNIEILSPIIKMYATQKLKNPKLNRSEFQNLLSEYLDKNNELQSKLLDDVLINSTKKIPNLEELIEGEIRSVIDGQQGKVETYEMFKALNDKWIAGQDFREKTLFEDFLFLDRASRDIGDTILIDIFDLKNMFNRKSLNNVMSVYTFMSGILIKNNFTVMNLPAYVNFYNINEVDRSALPKPEGTLEFAENMWGTFNSVDYRNSAPKIICFYVGRPSEYLDLPRSNFRFRDDGIDVRKTQNPMIEDQTNKTDWAFSNKCVGFNVDIGIRNQNIFYTFSIDQNPGVATSEVINTYLNMVSQASGGNVATQNNSLYNFYKSRSYQCTVECLGNAMIQPTMYFNLRHVPMFHGPYLVTQVEHSIQPGTFRTQFNGVRQGLFDLPTIDKFIQSVNKNLLTRVEQLLKTNKPGQDRIKITETELAKSIIDSTKVSNADSHTCTNSLDGAYDDFISSEHSPTTINSKDFLDKMGDINNINNITRAIIYSISYLKTYNNNSFRGTSHNYSNIELTKQITSLSNFSKSQYSCISYGGNTVPIALFDGISNYFGFMKSIISENTVNLIKQIGLTKYVVTSWPTNTDITNEYYETNKKEFNGILGKIKEAINLLPTNFITEDEKKLLLNGTTKQNTANETSANSTIEGQADPTCPVPIVNTYWPLSGGTGTMIQVIGSDFRTVSGITFDSQSINGYEVLNNQTIRIFVPETNLTTNKEVDIRLLGSNGNFKDFKFTWLFNSQVAPSSPGQTA